MQQMRSTRAWRLVTPVLGDARCDSACAPARRGDPTETRRSWHSDRRTLRRHADGRSTTVSHGNWWRTEPLSLYSPCCSGMACVMSTPSTSTSGSTLGRPRRSGGTCQAAWCRPSRSEEPRTAARLPHVTCSFRRALWAVGRVHRRAHSQCAAAVRGHHPPGRPLLARRVIAAPVLRVLAVGLAVVLPWTMISAHLHHREPRYPTFLWTCLAIIRAAEDPTLGRHSGGCSVRSWSHPLPDQPRRHGRNARGGVAWGRVVRPRDERSLGAALRRQAPILALLAILVLGAVYFLGPGASRLGAYGNLDLAGVGSRLFGSQSGQARGTARLTRGLSRLERSFSPFVLGLATAFAGVTGRLADRPVWFRFWRSAHSLRS